MNAVLQALFHLDQLCGEVLAVRPSTSRPYLASLQHVFAFLVFSERPAYSPAEFQRTVLPPWFERDCQHDSSEFLRYLLDAMLDEERIPERTGDGINARPDLDEKAVTGVVRLGDAEEKTDSRGAGAGDSSDVDIMDNGAERSPGEPAGLVRRLLTGRAETTYTCCACHSVFSHEDRFTDLHLALPEMVTRPLTAAAGAEVTDGADSLPMKHITVSDLLQCYLAPERLNGQNQYHCGRCAGLRDADRQLRLLTPPPHLVVSLVRFGFDRRTGARRKVLDPVILTERLAVPIAGRQPAQYRLRAAIMHAGDSLDAGHYFSFCRVSGGCSGGRDDADDAWWRLDDTSVAPVSAAAALGPPCRSSEAAYVCCTS